MFVIPADRLPAGFAERLEAPPAEPAPALPAATVVLLRDAVAGPEVLLLRRVQSAGFVPGAFVFPGGRVDLADADPALLDWCEGIDDTAPDLAAVFRVAAIRETFEETGVLLAVGDVVAGSELEFWRERLLSGEAGLLEVAESLGVRFALDALVHCAHWITPEIEPRRYDTHFFLARLPEGVEVRVDPREMSAAVWLTPARALELFRSGELPLVFPTAATLESLIGFGTVGEALAAFRGRAIRPILPRLVRTAAGVGIVVEPPAE